MKPLNVIPILIIYAALSSSAQWKSISGPEGGPVTASILEDGAGETVIEFNVAGYHQKSINIESNPYLMLSIPEAPIFLEKGYPELPRVNRSIVIPDEAKMKVEIVEAEYDTIGGVLIAPSKGSLPRSINPQTVPYTFSDFYKTDTFWPANTVELSHPFILRDMRGITVRFNIFRHNAVRQQLVVCKRLVVRVFADGIDDVNVKRSRSTTLDRDFNQIYKRFFLNYSENKVRSLGKAAYEDIGETGRMLIIAADNFYDSMIPLRDWRTRKGYITRLVKCSDVGTTDDDIQDYIQDMFDEDSSVTYIILVGEGSNVPSGGVPYWDYPDYPNAPKDPVYTLLAGADNYPDAYISRISAGNVDQVKNQVRRIIKYETDPVSGSWFQKACGIASHQGSPADSTRCNWLRTDLLGYGYISVDKLYDITSATPITNAINSGRGVVNYIGHGKPTEWGFNSPYVWPLFSVSDVQNLTNTYLLPFIFSVACEVGSFPDYSTCFAEAWLRSGTTEYPRGSISFYGSSIGQPWVEPCVAQAEAVDLLVAEDKITVGGLCFNGSCKMIEDYPFTGPSVFNTWHIFGDATTQIWTDIPSQFSGAYITVNSSSVYVNTGGVSGCTICASSSDNGSSYHKVVNNTSSYTFGTDVRPLYITITKHNYIPYQAVTGGTFTSNQTWYGTLYVSGDLIVPSGKKLTISPEAGVKFKIGKRLLVYGTIIAEGSSDEHIAFDIAGSGTWHGIHVYSSNNRFKYCDFKNSCYEGLELYGSPNQATNNRVEYCSFEDNYEYGLSIINNDNPKIVHCRNISNNDDGGIYINNSEWVELEDTWVFSQDPEDGIYSSYSEFLLDGCLVKWNEDGIYSYTDDYLDFSWDDPWGGGNSIHDNDDEGVFIYNYQYTKVWMDWNSDLPNSVYSNDGYEVQIIYSGSAQVFAAEVYWGSNPTWYGNVYHDEPLSSDQTGLPKSINSDFPWQSMNFVKSDNPHSNPREELSEGDLKLIIDSESDTDTGVEALKRLRMLMRRNAREEQNPVLAAELPDYLRTLYRSHKHTKVGRRALVFLAREEMRRDAYEEAITLTEEGLEFLDGADLQMTKEILTWLYIHTGEYEKANSALSDLSNSYGQDPECARYASSLGKMLYRATGDWRVTQPGKQLAKELLPTSYGLAQNYPNP
ncbi:MAG: right-handed parallel beta-helix repeat-containing protein, partial [Thermoplasmata archaeon]